MSSPPPLQTVTLSSFTAMKGKRPGGLILTAGRAHKRCIPPTAKRGPQTPPLTRRPSSRVSVGTLRSSLTRPSASAGSSGCASAWEGRTGAETLVHFSREPGGRRVGGAGGFLTRKEAPRRPDSYAPFPPFLFPHHSSRTKKRAGPRRSLRKNR